MAGILNDISYAAGRLASALRDLDRAQNKHDELKAQIGLLVIQLREAKQNLSDQQNLVSERRQALVDAYKSELTIEAEGDIATDSWIVDVVNGGSILAAIKQVMAFTNWWKVRHLATDVRVYFEIGQKSEAELFMRLCRKQGWDLLPLRRLSSIRPCN